MGAVFSIFAACLQRATVPRPGARMSDALRPEEVLTRVPVFAALGRVELAKLAAYLETMAIEPGHEVFRQGDPGDSLYVVADGALGVFVTAPAGPRPMGVGSLAPGELFGEMALFTGEPR